MKNAKGFLPIQGLNSGLVLATLFLILMGNNIQAADLKGYSMITDSIIMLYFDEGYINYHGLNEASWNDDEPVVSRLDLSLAGQSASYTISSSDDSDYSSPLQVLSVGRKSKGGDFSPVNQNIIIHDHYIYLKLPHPLKTGKNYSIDLNGLAENTTGVDFLYEPSNMISPAVHSNMIAYSTNSDLKFGYVYQWMGDAGPLNLDGYEGNNFYLIDIASGDTAFTGKMTLRKDLETGEPDTYNANDSPHYAMADVYECDFSSFNEPGEYKIYIEKIGCSYNFEIKEDAYREAFRHTAWGLYHQRSGPERDLPWSSWYKGTDHMPGVNGFTIEYSDWRIMDGANAFEELPANATGEVFPADPGDWMPEDPKDWGWGGYFDAGDFDRRHVHMIVSEYLLLAYELKPENFIDNELKIPENKNGIPDIIDEARWAIDMHRRLQGPTGGICGGMEQNDHPGPGVNSVTDNKPWYVYAEEPAASYHLAATNTQLAWCLAIAGDVSETDSLLSQAERVYAWAGDNMRSGDESKVAKYRMKAAAWLFRYTGRKKYHDQFLVDYIKGTRDDFASWVYIKTEHPLADEGIKTELASEITGKASDLVTAGKKRAYRWANFDMYGFHRVGGATTPYIFPLIFSWELTGDKEYLNYAYTTADFFMGGNPVNKVYVTGLGESHVETLLHLDSWFDEIDPMVPGIVPFGLHTYGSWMDSGSGNVYQPLGNFESCYPEWQSWPSHEMWFENRYLIIQNEFTVQQTQGPATGAYAYLCAPLHTPGTEVQKVLLNYDTINITIGASERLVAAVSPYDAENKNLTWFSGESTIANVQGGIVNAIEEGETWIFAESEQGGFTDSCLVRVMKNIEVTDIAITEQVVEIMQGSTDTLYAVIYPENATNQDISWSVENTDLVEIDIEGVITAKEPGQTKVTVISDDGAFSDDCEVTVLETPQYSYLNSPHPIPGRIEFEDYDIGGQYISFLENSAGNEGGAYREEDVDIQETMDDMGRYNVGWIRDGEWLEYTVDVAESGRYYMFLRAAVNSGGSSLEITRGGELLLSKGLENTGGWQIWETFSDSLNLETGEQILRFTFRGGESLFNLNYIDFNNNQWMTGNQEKPANSLNVIKIYPNPVDKFFFLSLDPPDPMNLLLIIKNISGKTIRLLPLENITQSTKVPVQDLPAGIYFLHFKGKNKITGKPLKIIKL